MTNAEWNQRHDDAMAADRARWAFAEPPFPPERELPVHTTWRRSSSTATVTTQRPSGSRPTGEVSDEHVA